MVNGLRADNIYGDKTEEVEWSMVRRPFPGHNKCGDRYFVEYHGNNLLMAVIDGLGHGTEAAKTGKIAISTLQDYSHNPNLTKLVQYCHKELRHTRGVVMSLASITPSTRELSWIGIGNVNGVLIRPDKMGTDSVKYMRLNRGVVGLQLPSLTVKKYSYANNSLLIMNTDGVKNDYTNSIDSHSSTDHIAKNIISNYSYNTDDALVLTARF